ncbi:hypothetical protein I552_5788 [Mycobacterium xenopi 3993]|nr:hypothetical protein I552_5788 [Mycobacterium xenopi 3993]
MTAYDAVAAGHTGLPWPDVHDGGRCHFCKRCAPRLAGPRSTDRR